MQKYKVTVVRSEASTKEFIVKASSVYKAKQEAIQMAVNTEFNSGEADYEVDYVELLDADSREGNTIYDDFPPKSELTWCVSTAHITAQDSRLLEEGMFDCMLLSSPEAHKLKVLLPPDAAFIEGHLKSRRFSHNIKNIYKAALAKGISYLVFDADGEVIEEWPKFDW
jgi:hypothetical protein